MYSIDNPLRLHSGEIQLLEDLEEILRDLSSLEDGFADWGYATDQLALIRAQLTDILGSEFYGLPRGSCLQPTSDSPPSNTRSSGS